MLVLVHLEEDVPAAVDAEHEVDATPAVGRVDAREVDPLLALEVQRTRHRLRMEPLDPPVRHQGVAHPLLLHLPARDVRVVVVDAHVFREVARLRRSVAAAAA